MSSLKSLFARVLQGSVLVPLLILIYVTTMPKHLLIIIKLYTDDRALAAASRDLGTFLIMDAVLFIDRSWRHFKRHVYL